MASKQEMLQLLREALPEFLQAEYGIDLGSVQQSLAGLEAVHADRTDRLFKSIIGKEGAEFDQAVQAVQEYFNKLPEQTRQALDNEEGLKYIWSQVQGNMAQAESQAQQYIALSDVEPESPSGGTSSKVSIDLSPNRRWKDTEIDALFAQGHHENPEVLRAVEAAYSEGRVISS